MDDGMLSPIQPGNPRLSASSAHLHGMLRGTDAYAMAAGGFARVPAIPVTQRFTGAADVNRHADMGLVQLYANQPALFRAQLDRIFGSGRREH